MAWVLTWLKSFQLTDRSTVRTIVYSLKEGRIIKRWIRFVRFTAFSVRGHTVIFLR